MNRYLKKLPHVVCYIIAFAFGMKQLREPDIWWQLLSGRWMVENGTITRTDVFSFTMAGQPWVNVKWLYEIIIALLEKITGPEGVILLQSLVNVAIVYLLFRTIKFFGEQVKQVIPDFAAAFAALLFLAMVEYRMAGRPEMVSHFMCTLYLFLLWKNPKLEWKQAWVLILLQCLWANMHEGYPVGMVMIGAVAAGSFLAFIITKDKNYFQQSFRGGIIFIAAALAILLNPNGIQLWKQPFEIYRQVWANKYTTELYSVFNPDYWTIQARWHVVLLTTVCIFWIIRLAGGIKDKSSRQLLSPVVISYLLMIPLFGYLSLTANRNIPFAQIILYPTVPYMMIWIAKKLRLEQNKLYIAFEKRSVIVITAIAVIFYISIVNNKYYKATDSPNRYGIHVSMLHNPTGAANFIKEHHIKGPAFSDYFVSSYLLWSLYPDFKSYIDLRDLDVFPETFFDNYFGMYNHPEKFDSLNKVYNFNYIVFSNSQLPSLQQKLYWGEGYNLLYSDPVASIYLKNSEANNILNHDQSLQKLFSWPQAPEDPAWAVLLTKLLNPAAEYSEEDEENKPIAAARYYNQLQNFPLSVKIMKQAIPELSDNAEANSMMGISLLSYATVIQTPEEKARKMDSAKIYLTRAIALDEKLANAYTSLGDIALMQNNPEAARDYYAKSLKLDNTTYAVHFYYALASFNLLKTTNKPEYRKDMIGSLEKSISLNPEFKRSYIYLAEAYFLNGNNKKARDNTKKALSMEDKVYPDENKMLMELKQKLNIK